jgi:hypothetical protein
MANDYVVSHEFRQDLCCGGILAWNWVSLWERGSIHRIEPPGLALVHRETPDETPAVSDSGEHTFWKEIIQDESHRRIQVFLKRILPVLLLLVWGAVFSSICEASPLMVEKNLFATDRKAPPPESADTSAKPAKPGIAIGNIQLDGVIIQSNAKRAVLRMKNQPGGPAGKKGQPSPFVTVREGQMVSDYRVSKIESRSISLEKDGQTFIVGLFAENKVVTPPSPPPAPVPVQQPMGAPGVAPQEAGANQPPGAQPQPGYNPQNPQQLPPGQGAPPYPDSRVAGNPASNRNQQNVYAPSPEQGVNQDPNQPAEAVEEEE